MSQIKIFFDTNVLVYAHDSSASYHTQSSLLLRMALDNQIQGVIAEQNVISMQGFWMQGFWIDWALKGRSLK